MALVVRINLYDDNIQIAHYFYSLLSFTENFIAIGKKVRSIL